MALAINFFNLLPLESSGKDEDQPPSSNTADTSQETKQDEERSSLNKSGDEMDIDNILKSLKSSYAEDPPPEPVSIITYIAVFRFRCLTSVFADTDEEIFKTAISDLIFEEVDLINHIGTSWQPHYLEIMHF